MKKFLKNIWNVIRGVYYSILLILGILGISQVVLSTEPTDINILITTISFFAIGYSIKNYIKIGKEIWNYDNN